MRARFLFGFVVIFFISCSRYPTANQEDFFHRFPKGQPIRLSCRGNDYNRYIAYLPSEYTLGKPFPVLFCFDPHADAQLALGLFKDYAEKNKMVVIASATLQNGLAQEEILMYLTQLYSDVKDKMLIDTTRIFAVGFSGGARVAAIFSQWAPVSGIISCSAGYYPSTNCVNAISIAGKYDMNYLETQSADNQLNRFSCNHIFLTFEGTHQWPPVALLTKAMDILHIWHMGSDKFIQSDSGKEKFNRENQDLLVRLKTSSSDSLWTVFEAVHTFLATYGSLPETDLMRKQYDSLLRLKAFTRMLDQKIAAENFEADQQALVRQAMGTQPIAWWKATLTNWQSKAGNDMVMQAVYKRLLAYVSLLSYSYTQAAIRQGDWTAVQYVLNIYGMADPENPDYHYLMACLYTHQHKLPQALDELKTACNRGLSIDKALNDPLLNELKPYLQPQ